MLEIYGPCITSADSKDWPRHRKILAAPFNETTMKFVWTQSLKQARQMVQSWEGTRGPCIPSVAKDTRTLSLNVLAATGFRRPYDFRSSSQPGVDEAGKYRNALQTVLDNALLLMLVPPRFLRLPFLPDSWTRLGKAAAAFKQYMERMLDEETSLLDRGEKGTGSLMTAFVRALDTQQKEQPAVKDSDGRSSKGLTRDEIFSDIFVINFAGHDTTANSLAFTMILLAANPEVQDWVAEEVREITKDRGSDEWKYDELFPSLKRSQAILVGGIYPY